MVETNASVIDQRQILTKAAQSDVMLYTIGIYDPSDPDQNPGVLKRLAHEAGGEAFFPAAFSEVEGICEKIAREIRLQYTLGYVSTNSQPGGRRAIRVVARVSGKELAVRTRASYLVGTDRHNDQRIFPSMGPACFVGFAFVAFAYCAYMMTESWIFQRDEHRNLKRLVVAHQNTAIDDLPVSEPDGLIGRISVARLGVSVIVMGGTDGHTLRRAAGHISGTALPGEQGNAGIAAQRDTFFRPLRDIRKGDVIAIATLHGDYRYRVVSTRVVDPGDISTLDSDGSDVLTLVTCYPFNFIGPAPSRFIVRGEQIS